REEIADVPTRRDRLTVSWGRLLTVEGGDDRFQRRLARHVLVHAARADVRAQAGNVDGRHVRPLPLPVGSSLNGSSLSTRTSAGRPSTRSAMMLRMISSDPPAMREEGDVSSVCWKRALMGA